MSSGAGNGEYDGAVSAPQQRVVASKHVCVDLREAVLRYGLEQLFPGHNIWSVAEAENLLTNNDPDTWRGHEKDAVIVYKLR